MSSEIIIKSRCLLKGNKWVSFRGEVFCCIGEGWIVNIGHNLEIKCLKCNCSAQKMLPCYCMFFASCTYIFQDTPRKQDSIHYKESIFWFGCTWTFVSSRNSRLTPHWKKWILILIEIKVGLASFTYDFEWNKLTLVVTVILRRFFCFGVMLNMNFGINAGSVMY